MSVINVVVGDLDGSNGFSLGPVDDRFSGAWVSNVGDVNDDGIDDIAVSAYRTSMFGRNGAGAVYVLFGHEGAWTPHTDNLTLNGVNGYTIAGAAVFENIGSGGMRSIGDFDGDGVDDMIIGSGNGDTSTLSDCGVSYIVYGHSMPYDPVLNLANAPAGSTTRFNGLEDGEHHGWSVSGAGDFNGDGLADIIVDAHNANPNGLRRAGGAYVVFGTEGGLPATFSLATLDGSNGFRLNGAQAGDYTGKSVSSIGDFNGDGFDDIVIGAVYSDTAAGANAGRAYVVFGCASPMPSGTMAIASLADGTHGFSIDGLSANANLGKFVRSAGDFNNDGLGDILLDSRFADPSGKTDAGEVYVIFGASGPISPSFNLTSLNGTNGFTIEGVAAGDLLGFSFDTVGDVNGDGVDDIAIGAFQADPGGRTDAGAIYVIFGGQVMPARLHLDDFDGLDGMVIEGTNAGDNLGRSVSGAGDINNDGFDDILVGAGGNRTAYVIFGAPSATTKVAPVAHDGAASGDEDQPIQGQAVATDVNGDDLAYILVDSADHGQLVFGADGSFTYTPDANFNGADSFTFKVNDGTFNSAVATIDLTVAAVNDQPRALAATGPKAANEFAPNGTVVATFSAQDPDAGDAAALQYVLVNDAGGRFAIVGDQLVIVDGVALDFEQATSHTVRVKAVDQGGLASAPLDVVIDVLNVDPEQVFGTAASETIVGGGGDDTLEGAAGADSLSGGGGTDTLRGGAGADTLQGDSGIDLLVGGDGDDVYILDASGDVVVEDADHGVDSVFIDRTCTLAANVENLTLTGAEAIVGSGNDLANAITGNDGANKLYGFGGADTVKGGMGADTVNGGADNDLLDGDAGNDYVIGGAGDDTLIGGGGDDILDPGPGVDRLIGHAGVDTFLFNAAPASAWNQGDIIDDFLSGTDLIDLKAVAPNGVFIGGGAFTAGGAIEARFDAALGQLQVDANNNGSFGAGDLAINGLTAVVAADLIFS